MDDVAAWRRAQRKILIAQRQAMDATGRAMWDAALQSNLHSVVGEIERGVLSFYWPFGGEFDPRPLVTTLVTEGWQTCLPVVIDKNAPMVFRHWWPGAEMVAGTWNIPVPRNGEVVVPNIVLAPLVGFDDAKYRLGHGGGYFDRTLGGFASRPLAIGVGYEFSFLPTIHPQPFDIPMNMIVTETTIRR